MTPALRVALVVHHRLELGTGAAGSTLALAAGLRHRGHQVDVIGLDLIDNRDGLRAQLAFPSAVARFVRRALRDDAYDVIDASTGDISRLTRRDVRHHRTAFVTRSHGLEPLGVAARRAGEERGELDLRRRYGVYHGGWRLNEVRRSLEIADAVAVLNVDERRYVEELGVDPRRIFITAPIASRAFAPAPDATSELKILVVGGTQWRKGCADAELATYEFLELFPHARATILGRSPAFLDAHAPTHIRGQLTGLESFDPSDASVLYASHSVFVHLSRFEGFGLMVSEAMSHGLCVVSTDIAGPRDQLVPGSGELVPVGDIDAAVAALTRVADNETRQAMSTRAFEASRRFEPDRVVDALVENYRQTVASKASANGTKEAP